MTTHAKGKQPKPKHHTAPHENKNHTTPRILKWFPTQY